MSTNIIQIKIEIDNVLQKLKKIQISEDILNIIENKMYFLINTTEELEENLICNELFKIENNIQDKDKYFIFSCILVSSLLILLKICESNINDINKKYYVERLKIITKILFAYLILLGDHNLAKFCLEEIIFKYAYDFIDIKELNKFFESLYTIKDYEKSRENIKKLIKIIRNITIKNKILNILKKLVFLFFLAYFSSKIFFIPFFKYVIKWCIINFG